jgi:Ca2+-binding EF-hand superfamily protein
MHQAEHAPTTGDSLIEQRFREFDINNNGVLSQFEVEKVYSRMGFNATDKEYIAQAMGTFGQMDADGSGKSGSLVCMGTGLQLPVPTPD